MGNEYEEGLKRGTAGKSSPGDPFDYVSDLYGSQDRRRRREAGHRDGLKIRASASAHKDAHAKAEPRHADDSSKDYSGIRTSSGSRSKFVDSFNLLTISPVIALQCYQGAMLLSHGGASTLSETWHQDTYIILIWIELILYTAVGLFIHLFMLAFHPFVLFTAGPEVVRTTLTIYGPTWPAIGFAIFLSVRTK